MTAGVGPIRAAFAAAWVLAATPAFASDLSPAKEARVMLERAVAAVKADEAKALADFSAGRDGFKDRELYVFCARRNGRVDAHIDPAQIGRNLNDLYDVHGVAFGLELMRVAQEGSIKGVSYMWPKPGTRTPQQKVTFVTRVADQVCGVGYYD